MIEKGRATRPDRNQHMLQAVKKSAHRENYRADIDGLRAIAVLAVIGFHAAPSMVPGGFIGVDVFFVVSGFLISGIIFRDCERSAFSWLEFYSRRVKRIFPALIVVLSSMLVFGWFRVLPDEFAQLGKHTLAGAAFVSNFAFWAESGYFDSASELKPLLHLWSLGVEEQFYFVWPVVVPFVFKYLRQRLIHVIAALIAFSFAVSLVWLRSDASGAFYLPQTRLWELLCGGLLSAFGLRRSSEAGSGKLRYDLLAGLGLATLAICILFLDRDLGFPGLWALGPVLGTIAVLHGSQRSRWAIKLLSNPILVGIGLISYPLYLWHLPILTFLKITDIGEASRLNKLAAIALSFVLAWTTYQYVERPIRFGHSWNSRRVAFHLIVSMAFVAAAGTWIFIAQGFPQRYPISVRPLLGRSAVAREVNEAAINAGKCFLDLQQRSDEFAPECLDPDPTASTHGAILLWGDSHAAHLYPGLLDVYRKRQFRLMRLMAAGCPPVIGRDIRGKPNCRSVNDYVERVVDTEHPTTVILAANWVRENPDEVRATIAFLKSRSVKRIILVGPVPQWTSPLHIVIVFEALKQQNHTTPERIAHSLIQGVPEINAHMREIARETGVDYVSPWEVLCNDLGCLARVGEGFEGITAWDRSHLTRSASVYVVQRLFGSESSLVP